MTEELRILHVVTYMGRGGLETMLMNYYRHIDRSKVQFDFLVHRKEKADYDDEIESLGGKIYRLPKLNPWSPRYLKLLESFLNSHNNYKIIHSHIDCMSAIPLKVANKVGIPVRIAHAHSSNQDKNYKYLLKLYYKKKISRYSTNLFACSEAAGQWMFGKPFSVLPNAIDSKKYIFNQEIRAKKRIELGLENELVIGHVGRFSEPKNHSFLIDIFAEIKKKKLASKLVLVGSGAGMKSVKEKVQSLGMSNDVLFLGMRSDVADIMQAMDVFVFPSLYEGLPVTIVEAQASGLPCIISDKVPIECKKTDLVTQIPLAFLPDKWAEEAIKMSETVRKNTYNEILQEGFDIIDNAKNLQSFYLKEYYNL